MAEQAKGERSGLEELLLLLAAVFFAVVQASLCGAVGAKAWNTLIVPGLALPLIGWRVVAGAVLLRQLVFGVRKSTEKPASELLAEMLAVSLFFPLMIWFVIWAVRP